MDAVAVGTTVALYDELRAVQTRQRTREEAEAAGAAQLADGLPDHGPTGDDARPSLLCCDAAVMTALQAMWLPLHDADSTPTQTQLTEKAEAMEVQQCQLIVWCRLQIKCMNQTHL